MELWFFISLFLRRLHWFILVFALCSAVGIGLAYTLPAVYRAEARLLVESEQIPDELAASTVQTQATEQLQIIEQRILTRDILVEMVNRLSIYSHRAEAGKKPLSAEEIVEDLRQRIVIKVSNSASKTRRRREAQATIVSVSFDAPTAQMAAAVTNEVVTLILNEDVTMRTRVARQTLEFFEQEVARLDKELAQKAAAILDFKQKNLAALPDSLDFRRNKQAVEQERLLQAERNEAELRDRLDRLIRLHKAARGANDLPPLQTQTEDQQRLRQLKQERTRLLAVLSKENPKVKVVDAQISALEQVVEEQLAGASVGEDGKTMTAYEVQLADLNGQIEYLAEQKKQIRAEITSLTASIEATPGNAISLDALERDYAAVQVQYNQAVANKAKAETGDTIEALSKGQRISVIEQAVAPREPTSPNRPVIAAAGVGGGVFLGVALVTLLEVFKKGIRRPVDLTKGLGITPFATLPYIRTRGEVWRRRFLLFFWVAAVFGALAAGLWAVHNFYMPLDLLLERIQLPFG